MNLNNLKNSEFDSENTNNLIKAGRCSVIYQINVDDKFYVLNRSVSPITMSSRYIAVLDAIGVHADLSSFCRNIFDSIPDSSITIIKAYPEFPNFKNTDQGVLNTLKREYCDNRNKDLESPIYFCRTTKLIDQLYAEGKLSAESEDAVAEYFGTILDKKIETACKEWFENIYSSLVKFFRNTKADELAEYNNQLTELFKQVSDEYTKLNKVKYAYKLETDRTQASIQKQKNYRDKLDERLDYRARRLGYFDPELCESITHTEEYAEYLRDHMRLLDEKTMFYIAKQLGYKVTKENYYIEK